MTKTVSRPASFKQLQFIAKMIKDKDLTALDDESLDRVADIESDVEIDIREASALIDALMAAPRKKYVAGTFAPLVSTYAERVRRAQEVSREHAEAAKAASAAQVAAGGHTALEGACVKCGHKHAADGSQCGEMVEVRMSDYSEFYPCRCEETVRGTAASEEANRLYRIAHRIERSALSAADEVRVFCRGDHVVVARGRKIPKGTKGQVIKVVDGQYGMRAFLLLVDGEKAWTALTNLEHDEATEGVE